MSKRRTIKESAREGTVSRERAYEIALQLKRSRKTVVKGTTRRKAAAAR
jgi:hypothetical protein